MKLKYNGAQTAIQFTVKGKLLNLVKGGEIEVTKAQAEALNGRPFVKKLIDKGIIEFSETKSEKPDTKTEKPLDDHTKDELLDIVKELKLEDITSKNTKAEIITAIEDARK